MPSVLWRTAVLVIAAAHAGLCQQAQPRGSRCVVPADEREVLSSFLRADAGSSDFTVVLNETQPSGADVDYLNLQLAAKGRAIPQDLRKDFKEKDQSNCKLSSLPGLRNVVLISAAQEQTIFREGMKGWNGFHKKYGENASLVTLSRVGFSPDRKLALVHSSSGIGRMAGGGMLYLLERKNDELVVKYFLQTWTT